MKDFLVKIWLIDNVEIILRITCPRDQIWSVLRFSLSGFMDMTKFSSVLESFCIEEGD